MTEVNAHQPVIEGAFIPREQIPLFDLEAGCKRARRRRHLEAIVSPFRRLKALVWPTYEWMTPTQPRQPGDRIALWDLGAPLQRRRNRL